MLATESRRAPKQRRKTRPTLTPEQREERLSAAREQLLAGIDTLLTSEGWQQLIQSRAWLRRYSLANLLMILQQCPDATDVRPMSEWKELGFAYMRKGTHKIKIWKPRFRKVEVEQDNPDDPTEVSQLSGFMLVSVVDVSQLQGDPRSALPVAESTPVLLTGDAPAGLWEGIVRQISARGYCVERGDCGEANGMTHFVERRVTVAPDLEPAQAAKTLTHELAHILCEHESRYRTVSRALMEVEAESVACIVSAVCGLDSLGYSVPYVAHWAADRDVARQSAERVLKVADAILHQLEGDDPPR
ncbi:hypothetical protein [Kibdelosporangium aridum]|uniref:hypothetical protein n=1 Tax=Kibdelosporangium aridum TaxID=2030 RepID=UPI000690CF02